MIIRPSMSLENGRKDTLAEEQQSGRNFMIQNQSPRCGGQNEHLTDVWVDSHSSSSW